MHGNLKRQATSATSTRESRSGETVKRLKGQKSHGTRLQSTLALTSQTEQPQSGLQRILTGGSQNEEMSIEQGGDVVMVDEIKEQRTLSLHGPFMGNLAAAWYDPEARKIQVLEDTKDTLNWDLACLVIEQVRPTLIIMSTRTQNSLMDKVEEYRGQNECELLLLSSRSCCPKAASIHLASVRFSDSSVTPPVCHAEEQSAYDESRSGVTVDDGGWRDEVAGMGTYRLSLVKLGCWMNINAPLATVAAGVLVEQVKKGRTMEAMLGGQHLNGLELIALESMDLERHMQINKDTLTSLAIFDVESHAFMYSDQDKQALSIFGKLDSTVTPLGKKLLHTWHLRPLLDLAEISTRHNAVEFFSSAENAHFMASLRKAMKGVRNVPAHCTKLQTGRGSYAEWKCLVDALTAALEIRNFMCGVTTPVSLPIVEKIRETITDNLIIFCQDMNAIIDWDASRLERRVAVRPGVDDELDNWREVYAGLDATLNQVALMIYPQVPPGISSSVNVVYLPQLGYLAVIQADADEPPEILGWESRFHTEDRYYYKTVEMKDLDDHFGDLYTLMIGKEIEIIQRLVEHLKDYEVSILRTVDIIAELDCILALARAARDLGLKRPVMIEEPVLQIRKGRHILFESLVPRYIQNDTMIASGGIDGLASMMIITGSNGSGKSAYGKQVALMVFLAQIGSFVPAEEAVIGICDKIFTRLQTRESTSRHASAFMIDLGQVSQALRGATRHSLIIMDEFGKGTHPADGAGLLAGTIEYLLQGVCPRSIVMTHFHELFANHFITEDRLSVRFCHMKTLLMDDSDGVQYLHKLVPSLSLTSNAAECALRHGIPRRIVDRAQEVTKCVSTFEISKLLDATLTMENIQEIKAAEELARRFLTWDIDPESEDVMEVLRQMIEETDVFLEEDISVCVEGTANRQNAATSDEISIDSSEENH
ncbi:DNA mismatch repair protein MSH5 [Cryptococcus gattii Ru294]|nr:DNA mismatch repair protein MSH5 [Cryptococcus gattii Ru294]